MKAILKQHNKIEYWTARLQRQGLTDAEIAKLQISVKKICPETIYSYEMILQLVIEKLFFYDFDFILCNLEQVINNNIRTNK